MDGGKEFSENVYRLLLDRFASLEASHHNLREQFEVILQEKSSASAHPRIGFYLENDVESDSGDFSALPGWGSLPAGAYFSGSPYRNVLDCMGHAVHVVRPGSGEIFYWNSAAEKLYGYKDYEAIRQIEYDLFDEEHLPVAESIMARLHRGDSWSGQLPLRRRTGQIFMAMVTKTPMYENGHLVGIITVSSNAAVFNYTNAVNMKGNHQDSPSRISSRKIQWHQRPQVAAVPQLASSVSNLASKVLSSKNGDVASNTCEEGQVESQEVKANRPPRAPTAKPGFGFSLARSRTEPIDSEKDETVSEFSQPSKIVAKFLSKLQIRAFSNLEKATDENIQPNDLEDYSVSNDTPYEMRNLDATNHRDNPSPGSDGREYANSANVKPIESENGLDSQRIPSTPSSVDSDSHMIVDSEICWEDLQLREEIGHGSFATVYRGVWNGSDVAVKVFTGNQYTEQTLVDYRKEIDIMRRLRHPNVLLFMGAVCTDEKLAMVTEYLIRGSLFKTLHKSSQSLDIKRRLRMAIDVARGMNYLHHRNPPIVHRDLKSSNLLVDKSWTVKVGDFGLSKLKHATFLTAKSGRGTPEWMAPEVLRNEPSTEKSDVYSFGVILWELMTEQIPWSSLNPLQVVGVVGFMDSRLEMPADIDPDISSIIHDCWRSNPNHRPSFEEIIHRMTDLVTHTGAGVSVRTTSTPANFRYGGDPDD